jgi:SagB-type dehydrogenase family enzyme
VVEIFRRHAALRQADRQQAGGSLADLFHENTKLHRGTVSGSNIAQSYTVREIEALARAYKRYPLHPQIALPQVPVGAAGPTFAETIAARRSRRDFGSRQLELAELSAVLQWSYGITGGSTMDGGAIQQFRAAPSAGALYPAEIYLVVRSVGGLEAGLYHFEVPDASLALLNRGDPTGRLHEICCRQEHAREAAVVVLISAVVERTKRKYGDRGYRYVLLDIGHLGQNLYLACAALDLAISPTCAFFDDEAADFLGIDGCDEVVVYVAFIGPRGDK